MPWFRAASRAGVRARNASTPSARADSSSVFISRSSLRNLVALPASARPALTSMAATPCSLSSNGRSLVR